MRQLILSPASLREAMSTTVEGEEFEEDIDRNECDRCGELVVPGETYVTGVNRHICKECAIKEGMHNVR